MTTPPTTPPAVPAPAHAGELRDLAEQLRRKHEVVEDCWYSCPESGECCDDSQKGCNCGASDHNAKLDELIALLPAATDGMDARRLDWLDSRKNLTLLLTRSYDGHVADNLRAAIDAAMSADDGRKP